jgi:hypothetical protein
MHILKYIRPYFKRRKWQLLVPEQPMSSNVMLMVKFANNKNEGLVKRIAELVFKISGGKKGCDK